MRGCDQRGVLVSLPRVDDSFVRGELFVVGASVPRFSFGRERARSCDGISELESDVVLLDRDECSSLRVGPWLSSDGGTAVDAASVLLFGSRFVRAGGVAFLSRWLRRVRSEDAELSCDELPGEVELLLRPMLSEFARIFCSQLRRSVPDICSQRALLPCSAPDLGVPAVDVCAIADVDRIALVSTALSAVRRSR